MSRAVALRLGLLVLILLGGCSYIVFDVLGVRLGRQPFPVKVELSRGGGLFAGSYVAYRGVDVGRISAVHLVPGGVMVVMKLDPGTKVPSRTRAIVRDLSAVGEQYLDLVPTSSRGPYLTDGSVIPSSVTQVPITVETLLTTTGRFTASVDTVAFGQLLQTLTTALSGTGPQLRTILVAGESLAADLNSVKPQTNQLINQGQTLLNTAKQTNPDVNQFSTNLAGLTAQLKASDDDIRALIANGNAGIPQLNSLLAVNTTVLEQLTANSTTLAQVATNNNAAVQALLAALPGTLNTASSIVRDGVVQSIFDYNDEEPVCTYTTDPNQFPEPTATHSSLTLGRTCDTKAPNLLQRGAAQAPEASK